MRIRYPKAFPEIIKFDGTTLTKDDLHYLHKKGEKLSLYDIAFIFSVDPEIVFLHMWKHGLSIRVEEYPIKNKLDQRLREDAEKKADERYQESLSHEHAKRDKLWQQAEEIYGQPKPKVKYFKVNGKTFADRDEIEHYNREVKAIYDQLIHPVKNKSNYNEIRSVDLSAMRLHRGLDMYKFSQVSGIPYKQVIYYEKTKGVYIPKDISDKYFKVLNISRVEFKKIKECLSGKRRDMHEEETRSIPDSVRKYVWQRDQGKCRKCGETDNLQLHHKHHYSLGGKHEARNLIILCIRCHALEHKGERGFGMLKAKAKKLGVMV